MAFSEPEALATGHSLDAIRRVRVNIVMNEERFWKIIKDCKLSDRDVDEWRSTLKAALRTLPPNEIIEWNHIFDRLAADAYTTDLIGACCIINSGAGDDGFYYFRCWLIGMGRLVFESALQNPDTLATHVSPHADAEAEIYGAARAAWMEVTGESRIADYPARNESAELKGEAWDTEDEMEVKKRFPRLAILYGL